MKKIKTMLTKSEVSKILSEVIDGITEDTDTIEALKIAECEISGRSGQDSKHHNGKAWTRYEDEKLCEMFDDRSTIREICIFLGRTKGGISARLKRLGKIKSRKEINKYLEY